MSGTVCLLGEGEREDVGLYRIIWLVTKRVKDGEEAKEDAKYHPKKRKMSLDLCGLLVLRTVGLFVVSVPSSLLLS